MNETEKRPVERRPASRCGRNRRSPGPSRGRLRPRGRRRRSPPRPIRIIDDLDLCPAWHPDNLERLATALKELGARLRDAPEDIVFPPITGCTLRELRISTWTTSAGDLDVLHDIPGRDPHHPKGYEELAEGADRRQFLGVTFLVADLGDIIVSKEIADREKDREALPELRALHARRQVPPEGPGSDPA